MLAQSRAIVLHTTVPRAREQEGCDEIWEQVECTAYGMITAVRKVRVAARHLRKK